MSKENRTYFEELRAKAEPYSDDAPELYLDATVGDADRLNAHMADALLKQDDVARRELGLKDGEYTK